MSAVVDIHVLEFCLTKGKTGSNIRNILWAAHVVQNVSTPSLLTPFKQNLVFFQPQ